jgi:Cys-tRNA(Pro)/Cys-tRNA(Cys) deacylase
MFFRISIIIVRSGAIMSTKVIKYLQQQKIRMEVREYIFKEKGAKIAADAIDWPVSQTVKTLVVRLAPARYILVLMPADTSLSLKNLARVLGEKKLEMAEPPEAEKVTGYLTGGISPFQTLKTLPAIMDESIFRYEKVAINGGKRGVLVIMAPQDIERLTKARRAELTTE